MEFHVSKTIRDKCNFDGELFSFNGNVILRNAKNIRKFAKKINDTFDPVKESHKMIRAGQLNAMGLIDEIFHYVCSEFRKQKNPEAFNQAYSQLEAKFGKERTEKMLLEFTREFPPLAVYQKKISCEDYLAASTDGVSNKVSTLEEIILLHLANENPAFSPFLILFSDKKLANNEDYHKSWLFIQEFFKNQPLFGPLHNDLITMLREPSVFSPNSLKGQLDYIRTHWAELLGEWLKLLLSGLDMLSEEEKAAWRGMGGGDLPPMDAYNYDYLINEYERFSPDKDWMPKVVLMAKTVLVWLDQLSKQYGRPITRLDQIPDEELDTLAAEGFTGLWLIGLWERSWGSKRIKQKCGNPEAAASAYSLHDYNIAGELGGWQALENLRWRLWQRGIRLASDMVPNHTGLDSRWVVERPDLFMQTRDCPFPTYTFNGENLSLDPRIQVYLEDHYYSKDDCAVVYKRVDSNTGDTRYIYHGNDGTGLPWNDTAQIDFLNPAAREAVIQEILHVAKNFPIIRFDAAMVLAKKHIRRLWYPEPGHGGDIASRSEYALSNADFDARIPEEFWREVVDRCAKEAPDTLLLAEAFWMMEGYFVRTLGMHRVYNSAFMNMLKREDNQKYRDTVKNTLEFDPQVLKRYVNFMNNPDEETAVAQFGKGDKYFGVCTLMVTMPGLPMFGHGQIQGFEEKYGMEYTKAYKNETPDSGLIDRHWHDIFPLMKKRYLFSGIENFFFYDVWNEGSVNENIFAYTNCCSNERAAVFYNNKYERACGWIKTSCRYAVKDDEGNSHFETRDLADALHLPAEKNTYLIFKELRSGLSFIRSVEDIRNNGMFISLNGFECQVLMDMTVITDDSTGKYRILCDTLGGRGVEDIDIALKEIFLKELYSALKAFTDDKFFSEIEAAAGLKTQKKRADAVKALLKDKNAEIDAWFKAVADFIAGNYGVPSVIAKASGRKSKKAETLEMLVKKAGKALEARLIAAADNSLYKAFDSEVSAVKVYAAYAAALAVKEMLGADGTFSNASRVISLWSLDRKLRMLLTETDSASLSAKNAAAYRPLFDAITGTLALCDIELSEKTVPEASYTAVAYLVENGTGASLLGLNSFNNILWYNKEKAAYTLKAAVLQYSLFASAPKTGKAELVEKAKRRILNAAKKCEYKADVLLTLLKPASLIKKEKSAAKKALAKKTSEKKSAAKKTSAKKSAAKAETKKTAEKKPAAKSVKKASGKTGGKK